MTPKNFMDKALEILKSHNIEPVYHFSPYAEGSEYEAGSGYHVFWDKDNNWYRFMFSREGECIWNSINK